MLQRKSNYGADWEEVREWILEREGHQCWECGSERRLHVHHIERKLSKSGNGSQQTLGGDEVDDALLDVDRVQYLYHLYKTDQNTSEYLNEWKSDDLEELSEFLADATGDDRYESVMDMTLSQF